MGKMMLGALLALLLVGCATDHGAIAPGRATGAEGTASGSSGNATGTSSTGTDVYGQPGATPQ